MTAIVVVRRGPVSLRLDARSIAVCSVLLLATLIVGVWSIMVGDFPMSVGEVLRATFGHGGDDAEFIVQTLRLPRALTGMLVGAALGMSGAIFQSIARNPLGSPDIIGFESGAAFGAVLVIVVLHGSTLAVAGGAVAGGLAAALAVYLLAYQRGLAASRLVLVGIGIGFAASARRRLPDHPRPDLRRPAGRGVAHRLAQRAELGPGAHRRDRPGRARRR